MISPIAPQPQQRKMGKRKKQKQPKRKTCNECKFERPSCDFPAGKYQCNQGLTFATTGISFPSIEPWDARTARRRK